MAKKLKMAWRYLAFQKAACEQEVQGSAVPVPFQGKEGSAGSVQCGKWEQL